MGHYGSSLVIPLVGPYLRYTEGRCCVEVGGFLWISVLVDTEVILGGIIPAITDFQIFSKYFFPVGITSE